MSTGSKSGLRLAGTLHPLLYSGAGAVALTLYSSHIALVESGDLLPYLGMVFASLSVVAYGQVVLQRIAMRVAGCARDNVAVTMPLSLAIQAGLFALLIKWRNTDLIYPLLHNKVYVGLTVLAVLGLAAAAAAYLVRRAGVTIRSRVPVRVETTLAILAIAVLTATVYMPADASDEKNVVLISIDSWRYDHRASVRPELVTPNVTALESKSIIYENLQVHAPYTWTSLSSIMTSLESPFHGVRVNGQVLNDEQLTLAEILGANGYSCFAAADIDLPTMGIDQGFSTFSRPRELGLFALYGFNLIMGYAFPGFFEPYCYAENNSMPTTVKGLEYLRRARSEKFFMWLHYYDEPHIPYVAPGHYVEMYNGGKSSWVTDDPAIVYALKGKTKYLKAIEGKTLTDADLEYLHGFYKAEVSAMDRQLGMILAALEKHGLFDNTLIVLTADHGEDFGERNQFTHGSNLYEGLLHVPLVIKPAGSKESSRVTEMVRGIDIAPAVLRQVGIAMPAGFHGRDIVPGNDGSLARHGDGVDWSFAESMRYGMYWPFDKYGFSYTSERYKYIALPLEDQEELYDLQADPGETVNIAESSPEAVAKIHADLIDYFDVQSLFGLVPLEDKMAIGEKQLKMLRALGYVD